MDVLFVEYPRCSTCVKARRWLEERGVAFIDRHIVEEPPTAEELKAWHEASGLPVRRFFNTSGAAYRETGVKQMLDAGMTDAQCYGLLAGNGMLVKRPLLVVDGRPATPGFKPDEWEALLGLA